MRYHDDPRLTPDRVGQVEFELGGYSRLVDGIARHYKHEFRPYRWRDPARARDWARLPPDLIELMQAEAADDGEPPLELPKLQPPARRGSGRRLDAVLPDRPPRARLREAGPGPHSDPNEP